MKKTSLYLILAFLLVLSVQFCNAKTAVFYDATLPTNSKIPQSFLESNAEQFDILDSKKIADANEFNIKNYERLILPDSSVFPVDGAESLEKFVKSGGDMVLFGGPAFSNLYDYRDGNWVRQKYKKYQGQWLDEKEIRNKAALENASKARDVLNFEDVNFNDWQQISRFDWIKMDAHSDKGINGKAGRFEIRNFNIGSWNLWAVDVRKKFKAGDNCIYFYAKGDGNTPQMVLQITEKDKSRWMAVIDLKQQWTQYAITALDFKYLPSEGIFKRGLEGDRINVGNCEQIMIGLSAFANAGKGDHTFYVDEIKAAKIELPSDLPTAGSCSIKYFADYVPYLLKTPVKIDSCVAELPKLNTLSKKEVYAVEGFTIPEKSQFMPLLVTDKINFGAKSCAAGMVINYSGEYKNSVWAYCGITDANFYGSNEFKEYFKSLLTYMKEPGLIETAKKANEEQKDINKKYEPFNYVLGTQAFGASYQLTKDDLLTEQARNIYEMGSNTLKCEISSRESIIYNFKNKENPKTLVEAASSPTYQKILEMPFDYYLIWTYECGFEFGGGFWRDGMTEAEKAKVYKEYYDFCCYLLKKYNNSRKTFYLGHWEGDWMLLKGYRGNPTKQAISGMIGWLSMRQKACDDAKRDVAHSNVEIYNYTEVTRVLDSIKGLDTLTNSVLPYTNIDYVSYSSYESEDRSAGDDAIAERYRTTLNYLESKLPKKNVPGKRVWIGEYGFQRSHFPDAFEQERLCRIVNCAALEWGCPFVLYWQMYCNEGLPSRNDSAGFWLIDNQEIKQPVYLMHYHYLQNSRNYVNQYRQKYGKNPSQDEFRGVAKEWLCTKQ